MDKIDFKPSIKIPVNLTPPYVDHTATEEITKFRCVSPEEFTQKVNGSKNLDERKQL
nr:MAG TPA: hypothetical protein [Caudoviricetes sp.]